MAASGRLCLTILFNICTITCAVAIYVHNMISFDMYRHSCAKFVLWLQMPLIVLEFLTLLLVLHIQHVVLASGFTDLSAVFSFFHGIVYSHTCCKTPDYKYWMPTLVKEITVLQKME